MSLERVSSHLTRLARPMSQEKSDDGGHLCVGTCALWKRPGCTHVGLCAPLLFSTLRLYLPPPTHNQHLRSHCGPRRSRCAGGPPWRCRRWCLSSTGSLGCSSVPHVSSCLLSTVSLGWSKTVWSRRHAFLAQLVQSCLATLGSRTPLRSSRSAVLRPLVHPPLPLLLGSTLHLCIWSCLLLQEFTLLCSSAAAWASIVEGLPMTQLSTLQYEIDREKARMTKNHKHTHTVKTSVFEPCAVWCVECCLSRQQGD